MEKIVGFYPYWRFAVGYLVKNDVDSFLEQLDYLQLPSPMDNSQLGIWQEAARDEKLVKKLKVGALINLTPRFKKLMAFRSQYNFIIDVSLLAARLEPEGAVSYFSTFTGQTIGPKILEDYLHYFFDPKVVTNLSLLDEYLSLCRFRGIPYMELFMAATGNIDIVSVILGVSTQIDSVKLLDTIASASYIKFMEVVKYGKVSDGKLAAFWAKNAVEALKTKQALSIGTNELSKLLEAIELQGDTVRALPTREEVGEVVDGRSTK